MKKGVVLITLLLLTHLAHAQNATAGASQYMELAMAEVIGVDMTVPGGSGNGGSTVDLPINGISAMADGVESPDIEVTLHGTTGFEISVQASASTFTYTGTSTTNNAMNVADVLSIIVTENNTGGSVASGFSSYQSVDGITPKKLIDQGLPGVRSFSFKYKASPGFNYSAGTYTTNIVYTITKI